MELEPISLDWNGNELEQELELEDMKHTIDIVHIYRSTIIHPALLYRTNQFPIKLGRVPAQSTTQLMILTKWQIIPKNVILGP